ncbi:uncharacterized protein LOC113561927 [Ooceraea biroi]|uniref:uncharacterized protein LOC113561927 n=1 Tax=Ooceraea biroi TaxID=2015173 RepID=UPI000F092350|nr:uncharacterized protein LOC113561927 [Ooceraea biroi]
MAFDLHKGYNKEDIKIINEVLHKYDLKEKTLVMYTDGSKSLLKQSTGAGIALEDLDIGYTVSLPIQCSVFTAEAMAISSALKVVETQTDTVNNIIVFTDSRSVLQALMNNHLNVYQNKYVIEIKKLYSKFKDIYNVRIIFVWIPAHFGITGNELADYLAKTGTKEPADNSIEIPIRDLRCIYKNEAWCNTQDKIEYESRYKGVFYYTNFYNRQSKLPWFHGFNEERYFITFVNRVRANHYNLNASLARKNIVNSERCECGYMREDIDHVVWQCHRYDEERMAMGDILWRRDLSGTESVAKVLKRGDRRKTKVIYSFIKKIGRIV